MCDLQHEATHLPPLEDRFGQPAGEAAPFRSGYVNADCDGTDSLQSTAG